MAEDARPKVRIIVEMFGGTIQGVYVDNEKVNVTDVVFTENHKYGSEADPEFEIEEGPLEGDIIYCHHEGVRAGDEYFGPVMKAAEARVKEIQRQDAEEIRRRDEAEDQEGAPE